MATIFPYAPTGQAPVTFSPILDGQTYSAIITSSFYGQRPYLNLYDLSNNLIVSEAVTGSPNPIPIQSMSWANGLALTETVNPHGFKVGAVLTLTIADTVPTAYNGTVLCLVTSPTTFSYSLSANPGLTTSVGSVAQNLNLVGGYFTTSSLVFRTQAGQFETNP